MYVCMCVCVRLSTHLSVNAVRFMMRTGDCQLLNGGEQLTHHWHNRSHSIAQIKFESSDAHQRTSEPAHQRTLNPIHINFTAEE